MQPQSLDDLLALSNEQLVIIVFTTTWSGAANMLLHTFDRLGKVEPALEVLQYDKNDFANIAQHFGVSDIPTTVFLHEQNEVDRFVGPLSLKRIQERLEPLRDL